MILHTDLPYPGDRIDSICFGILREILLNRRSVPNVRLLPEQRIAAVEHYLQHHFDENINLDELAERFGFSHSGFYWHWKKSKGGTPLQYIAGLKLKHAAKELLQSRRSVASIAQKAGFSGTTPFYRKFKEHFGMTPRELRNLSSRAAEKFPDLF